MPLHRNIYSFVYRGEDAPESKDVIWIHHEKRNDIQSAMIAEIWIKNKWEPLIWGSYKTDTAECCCCGSPFVREEGKASATMREASNIAKGAFAFSAGHKSKALADHSVAIGSGLIADKPYQTVLGRYNNNDTNALFVIGVGDSDENRLNAIEIDAVGNVNIPKLNIPQAEKIWNSGSGEYSAELPGGSSASGVNSVAEGLDTIASGNFSHSEGLETQAIGKSSHVEGQHSIASGECSHSEGRATKASGLCSHAEGYNTEAAGGYSHSEGLNTKASGARSHAEGMNTAALGRASHAEGDGSTANGNSSHANGKNTQANGNQSFTQGTSTLATNENESAFGKYNRLNNNQIFSIGIGTSESSRENALEVFTTGEVNIPNLKGYVKTDLLRTDEDLKSVSLGVGAIASGAEAMAIGHNTYASGNSSQAFGNESNAIGYGSHAEGYYTTAIGYESHAEGIRTVAVGSGSHAEGSAYDYWENGIAGGNGSHSENSSVAFGNYSHSEGISFYEPVTITYTDGVFDVENQTLTANFNIPMADLYIIDNNISHLNGKIAQYEYNKSQIFSVTDQGNNQYVFRFDTEIFSGVPLKRNGSIMIYVGGAYGDYSHTEGEECLASGKSSHAGGYKTKARGNYSHAEGNESEANADQSYAGGINSESNGDNSFAFGDTCDTKGNSNIAVGHHVFTNGYVSGEFACGKYNDPGATTIFSLGIGTDNQNRKNAIEVLSDGTIRFYNSGDGNYYTLQQIINAINNN